MESKLGTIATNSDQPDWSTSSRCIYIVATLATQDPSDATTDTEPDLRQMLGAALTQGQGDVLLVADSAASANLGLAQLQAATDQVPAEEVPALTARETEVLRLVAKGLRSHEVATALSLSIHTVNTHLRHLFQKLGVCSRSEAVFEATRLNLFGSFQLHGNATSLRPQAL